MQVKNCPWAPFGFIDQLDLFFLGVKVDLLLKPFDLINFGLEM